MKRKSLVPHGPSQGGLALCLAGVMLTLPGGVRAVPPELLRAVPDDALAVYWIAPHADPVGEAQPPTSLEMAGFLIDQARDWGLLANLNDDDRVCLDVFSTIPLALEHPHAVMLLDIQAAPRTAESHRLKNLQAALVMLTKGDNAKIEHHIRHLLRSYTNTEDTALTSRELPGGTVYGLRDRRAADWVELAWGRVGDFYLVTIGVDAMTRVLSALDETHPRLSDDEWFRGGWETLAGPEATFAAQIQFDRLPGGDDEALARKVEQATRELGVSKVDRGLWTLVQRDRAIVAKGILLRDGRDELQWITGGELTGDALSAVVPSEAAWYAVLRLEPRDLLRAVAQTYVAARSLEKRRKLLDRWQRIQERSGVNVDDDLLSRLRPPLVSHGFPKHAFGLPLAWTRVIPIDGDVGKFRDDLNRVLEAARDEMPTDELTRLRRDPDGVWYLHFGLDGPAIAVLDRFVVISFSPFALRQNFPFLRGQRGPASATAPQTPDPSR